MAQVNITAKTSSSFAADALDVATDFVPLVGPGKDIYKGIRDGDVLTASLGVVFFALDVATLGEASIVKGSLKLAIKQEGEIAARVGGEMAVKEGIQLTKRTFGHTFSTHGDDMTNFLINRAKGSNMAQG